MNDESLIIMTDALSAIESAYYDRQSEYYNIRNRFAATAKPNIDEDPICIKVLLVMLYSHYEGFVKYISVLYVSLINDLKINTNEVCCQFAAATLHRVFEDVENNKTKCDIFKNMLPDDSSLHKLHRRSVLLSNLHDIWSRQVKIDDTYINTESNLGYPVLCRTLYSLGLPYNEMEQYRNSIAKLLQFRNPLAHGAPIGDNTYIREFQNIEADTWAVIESYKKLMISAIVNKRFLLGETS